eukprot:maker-scaffold188_size271682-snap-gene-1.31 protein:Tk00153 transcript:maker-scaffold188_size271682-snap-gene-1.31-mRNA-1 annotation:"hypothetical protein TcasGA2_TC007441"
MGTSSSKNSRKGSLKVREQRSAWDNDGPPLVRNGSIPVPIQTNRARRPSLDFHSTIQSAPTQHSPSPIEHREHREHHRNGRRHKDEAGHKKDKFANFRNITQERDVPPLPHNRSPSPLKRTRRRSPSSPKKSRSPKKSYSPRKSPTKRRSPDKKLAPLEQPSRRSSEISVLELGQDSPEHFRQVRDPPHFSKSMSSQPPPTRSKPHLVPMRRARSSSPPQKKTSPKGPPPSKRYVQNKKRMINQSVGSSNSFTNIALVKSATQSVDSTISAVSNFGERTKIEPFKDKQDSLRNVGLDKIKFLNNQFADQKVPGVQTFDKAKRDLASDVWETEIKGLEIFVSLARDKPEILRADMKQVVRLMMFQLKNLRSQVCRAAAQTCSELFFHLGKAMEVDLEKVVAILLQRAADTNKFIRESCLEALEVMLETVTVFKALESITQGGNHQKSVVIRSTVTKLMDKLVNQMGAERVMGSSSEFQAIIFQQGAKLLTDSGAEVRKHAKHMFAELVRHQKFEATLERHVQEQDRRDMKKALDALYGH